MKKSLLLSAALAASCTAFALTPVKTPMAANDQFAVGPKAPVMYSGSTRASGSINFTYAGEPYSALSLNNMTGGVSRVYMMFEMAAEDVKLYAGNKVTGFTVYSPTNQDGTKNSVTEGRFFYTTDMKGENYSQEFKFSTQAYAENVVKLDTPYTITGDEPVLVFGYSIVVPKANDMYYMPVDYEPVNVQGVCIYGSSNNDTFPKEFGSAAEYYGALCMSVTIEGDNLPENIGSISEVDTPNYLPLTGDGVDVNFLLRNGAANPITSFEVTTSVTGMPDLVQSFTVSGDFPYNTTKEFTVKGVKAAKRGMAAFSMKITKINGEPFNSGVYTANVPAYDNGFPQAIVAEDFTGTWCGWCPGGIEALEYLKKNYPDRAIAIGAHNGDAMAIDSYQKVIEAYISGFPTILYNRSFSQTPTSPYNQVTAYIDAIMKFFDFPAYGKVFISGMVNEDQTAINAYAKSTFVLDSDTPHYLTFVITEDGIGPYSQANYFGQAGVAMNGWEKKGQKVSTVYDDVARYYDQFPGIPNSLPAKIKAYEEYKYEIEIPLKTASGANILKNDNFKLICFITNAENGRIVNAAQIDLNKTNTGVASVADDSNVTVEGGNGEIIVNGTDNFEVYTLSGVKVSNKNLPAGLYLVKTAAKTVKVIVK